MELKGVESKVHEIHSESSSSIEATVEKKKEKRKMKRKTKEKVENCVINNHKYINGVCDNIDSVKIVNKKSNGTKIVLNSKSENAFVTKLINTIPKVIYFKTDNLNEIREEKHAKAQEKLEDIGLKRKVEKLSKSVRNKRSKLDPDQQKSVTQLQVKLATPKETSVTIPPLNHQYNSIETLRQRLQTKLAALRNSRQSIKPPEVIEKKRLKKQMIAMKKKNKKQAKGHGLTIKTVVKTEKKAKPTTILPSKPVYNKEGKMVFSKFDFSDNGYQEESRKKKGYTGKDYKSLLNKLEREKEKFAKLKETDEEKAKQFQEKNLWKSAIEKAEGVKVKKDEDLLKKALKRKEYNKKKTKKAYEERIGTVKKKIEQRQRKREKNIQARKEDKKKHKIKRGAKKGRLLPNAL